MRGIVEFFDERRGFGKIQPLDGSPACFAHFSHLTDTAEQVLVQGEEVEFDVHADPKGPQARNIVRTEVRHRGAVKAFDKGFGFITPADGAPDILHNELYIGRMVWNKLRYLKDPDTGKRVSRPNPESEWGDQSGARAAHRGR